MRKSYMRGTNPGQRHQEMQFWSPPTWWWRRTKSPVWKQPEKTLRHFEMQTLLQLIKPNWIKEKLFSQFEVCYAFCLTESSVLGGKTNNNPACFPVVSKEILDFPLIEVDPSPSEAGKPSAWWQLGSCCYSCISFSYWYPDIPMIVTPLFILPYNSSKNILRKSFKVQFK